MKIKDLGEKIKALACGLINGVFGGGAGLVVVPLLKARTKDVHKAHSTAPAVTAVLSVMSAALYIVNGNIDWSMTLYAVIGIVPGAVLGAFLLPKVPAKVLERIFAAILIIAAIRMLTA